MPNESNQSHIRVRREPPRFRVVEVRRVERPTPRMARLTLGGPALEGFQVDQPAASVRLLLPSPGTQKLVLPAWNGNEFLLPDGRRPTIRTFTPRRADPAGLELDLDVVIHTRGAASMWIERAAGGDPAAVSGPGRGYAVDPKAPHYLLAGDETALPAICQLIEAIPASARVDVIIEIADPVAQLDLPEHPQCSVRWVELPAGRRPGAALLDALPAVDLEQGAKVWVAGEAAAMHRIRRHCFDDLGLSRADVTIRGYWKFGR
jgi:NADPH-dependent ferric siderophore reductase